MGESTRTINAGKFPKPLNQWRGRGSTNYSSIWSDAFSSQSPSFMSDTYKFQSKMDKLYSESQIKCDIVELSTGSPYLNIGLKGQRY